MRNLLSNLSLILIALTLAAPARAAEKEGQKEYLLGLDSLQRQQWKDAAEAVASATDADDENGDYHTAYAIASMLAGDVKTAKSEFNRAEAEPQR